MTCLLTSEGDEAFQFTADIRSPRRRCESGQRSCAGSTLRSHWRALNEWSMVRHNSGNSFVLLNGGPTIQGPVAANCPATPVSIRFWGGLWHRNAAMTIVTPPNRIAQDMPSQILLHPQHCSDLPANSEPGVLTGWGGASDLCGKLCGKREISESETDRSPFPIAMTCGSCGQLLK